MLGYVTKQLKNTNTRYQKDLNMHHIPQHQRNTAQIPKNQSKKDESKLAVPEGINCVQKILGSVLDYAKSADPTILMELSTLTREQAITTAQNIKNLHHILDYLGTHPYSII